MRVVIWDTKELAAADWEGVSDAFVRCFFDTKQAKETDTHYRCGDGKASFNYRLLYDLKAPKEDYNFTVQVWDRDFFASNDLIGEVNLDLKHIFNDVIEAGRTFSLSKKYYNSFLKDHMPADVTLQF
jgi:Ca2+-dependent lipid-binding protein